jgi:hypothetical protein
MKLTLLTIALFAIAPLARAQDAPPKVEPPPDGPQNARTQEERARALENAGQAVRRAAQNQQNQQNPGAFGGGGGTARFAPQRLNIKPIKGAWLGLSASQPPAALRHQLKLSDGTGLVVDFVQPKSPADQAGIKQYDLLTKLNEQILINPEQLAVLVRTYKPEEEIHLTFFREGERRTQSVTLVEHELPPLDDIRLQFNGDGFIRPNPLPPAPGGTRGGGGGGGFGGVGGGGFGGGAGGVAGGGFGGGVAPANPGAIVDKSEHSITWLDGRQQITVTFEQDRKLVTVIDNRSKKMLYQGPIDATDQQKSLSPEARGAIERVRAFLKANPSVDRDAEARPSGY